MAPNPKPRGFLGHAATYAVGNIARKVVGLAMLPVYTRYLTPAEYGVIGLLTFALAFFEPIFGARLGRAIPKFYFDTTNAYTRRTVIWGAIGLTSVVSACAMTLLVALRGIGSELLFGTQGYALALGLFAVNLLTLPIEDTGMMYVRIRQQSRLFLGISIGKLLLQVSLNLLLVVYWKEGVVGIVLSGILSSLAVGAFLLGYVAVHEIPAFDPKITREMLKFCWPLWFSGLAGLYIASSGGMYLRVFDNLSDVGRLELAMRFAGVAGTLLWGPFFQHWEPMSYLYCKEERGKIKFQVAFIGMSTVMFVGGLGISIFSEPIIRLMAAKSFRAAAGIVPILTLGFVLNSLRSFFNFSFLVTGRTKVQSVYLYVTALAITVAYVLLIPPFGLSGAAYALGLGFSGSFIYTRLVSRRYYDPGFNLSPIAMFSLIGAISYICANVLFREESIALDLLVKTVSMLAGGALIVTVGVRAIVCADASALAGLPWPLRTLDRLAAAGQSGAQNSP